jgi:uncharacterized protein YjbJ (UPF0337 family)
MASGTRNKWEGRWEQLKGRAQKLWGNLTNDDFQRAKGDFNQLVGIIRERTGKTQEEIERQLNAEKE